MMIEQLDMSCSKTATEGCQDGTHGTEKTTSSTLLLDAWTCDGEFMARGECKEEDMT
jgi:hypothetical protein